MVGTGKGLYAPGIKTMKWKILTSLTYQKLLQYKYTPVTPVKAEKGKWWGKFGG